MAITPEFLEQVAEALDQLGYGVETEENLVGVEDADDVTLPGYRRENGTPKDYVSLKLSTIKAYIDDDLQAQHDAFDLWFGLTDQQGIRKAWSDYYAACQDEWATLKTDAENATELANNAAESADEAATNANQKAGVAEDKAAQAEEKGDYAKGEADRAKNLNDHPAYIGEDDYWYMWDYDNQRYVRGEYARGEAATISVGSVSTLEPDQRATVNNSGTEGRAVLNFGIPRGVDGAQGPKGDKGDDLDYSTMTTEEKSELNDTIVQHIVNDNLLGPTYDEVDHGFNFPKAMHVQYDAVEHGFTL